MKNLLGQKFGRLTVIALAKCHTRKSGRKDVMWECECECGNRTAVRATSLLGGHTQSCGCLWQEAIRDRYLTHGMNDTRLHKVWRGMKTRCYNPNADSYKNYGGRGITICDEWLGENGFQNFYDWAMANGYNPEAKRGECTIDRIDNDRGYSPDNCRWVSMVTQIKNQRKPIKKGRTTIYYEIDGETHSISEWCKIYDLQYMTVYNRIRRGWNYRTALQTQVQ